MGTLTLATRLVTPHVVLVTDNLTLTLCRGVPFNTGQAECRATWTGSARRQAGGVGNTEFPITGVS